jgi:hypothetical protein
MALLLGRVKPGMGEVTKVAAKSLLTGAVAFAPIVLAGMFLPSTPTSFVVKAILLLPAILLFRFLAVRVLRLFSAGERDDLVSMMDRRGMGAVARRII